MMELPRLNVYMYMQQDKLVGCIHVEGDLRTDLVTVRALAIVRVAHLVEVIFVELAHETREIRVFEMLWQDQTREFIWILHHKRLAVGSPC